MKQWFGNLKNNFASWMYGRYGSDELSHFLSMVALVLLVMSLFVPVLSILVWAILIWSTIRCFSKKIGKRQKERAVYLRITGGIKTWFKRRKNIWRDRKTHKYYKCPNCKAYLRVPKGKGEITITCPKCKNKMDKKT